jgi:hypothetical protein
MASGDSGRAAPKPRRAEGNATRDTFKQSRLPIANAEGIVHLHVSPEQPEAAELVRHVEGMTSTNTDHHGNDAAVFNPSVSKAQFRAMQAAKSGNSTLGIPKSVGEEFAPSGKKRPKVLPERVKR